MEFVKFYTIWFARNTSEQEINIKQLRGKLLKFSFDTRNRLVPQKRFPRGSNRMKTGRFLSPEYSRRLFTNH